VLKMSECMKARATWVMFETIDISGTTLCCLKS
jgi:hypothetical protein